MKRPQTPKLPNSQTPYVTVRGEKLATPFYEDIAISVGNDYINILKTNNDGNERYLTILAPMPYWGNYLIMSHNLCDAPSTDYQYLSYEVLPI